MIDLIKVPIIHNEDISPHRIFLDLILYLRYFAKCLLFFKLIYP